MCKLDHINNVKALADHFFYFEVFVKYKDVIMIFPESFVTLTPTLKSHLEDQADERVDYGVCDDMFDARDVQNKGERTPR